MADELQLLRVVKGVVEEAALCVCLLVLPLADAQSLAYLLLGQWLMGAQCHHHIDIAEPPGQDGVYGLVDHIDGCRAGEVGHHQQDDADGYGLIAINNILYDLATGISRGGTVGENQFVDYNLFYSCTADYSNIPAGAHDVTGTSDPFTDSGARNYTLKSGSEALAKGMDAGVL